MEKNRILAFLRKTREIISNFFAVILVALAAVECRVECWAAAEVARVGPEEGREEVWEVGGGWVVEDTSVPLTGMVTN